MSDENVEFKDGFDDAPIEKSEVRAKTPERKPAVKRGRESFFDDEPDLKKVIREDDDVMDDINAGMIDSIEMKAMMEDRNIIYHAILGHDLTEVYSNQRLQLAADRHYVAEILSTDVRRC